MEMTHPDFSHWPRDEMKETEAKINKQSEPLQHHWPCVYLYCILVLVWLNFDLGGTRDTTAHTMYLCRLSRERDDDVLLYPNGSSQEQQTAQPKIPVLGNIHSCVCVLQAFRNGLYGEYASCVYVCCCCCCRVVFYFPFSLDSRFYLTQFGLLARKPADGNERQ